MTDRRLKVWIVTPELHREGGTERSLAEQLDRWRSQFDIRVYSMKVKSIDMDGIEIRRIWWMPGPHLLRYTWWLCANRLVRAWDARGGRSPDVLHSPGVNCLDAHAIGVHILFAKYWEAVRRSVLSDLFRPATALRSLHRVLYWSLLRLLERHVYSRAPVLWANSQVDAREIESRFGRSPGTVPVIPYGVDIDYFSEGGVKSSRLAARDRFGIAASTVLLIVGNDPNKKGLDVAIAATARLPESVVLAVAGRMRQEAPEMIARHRVTERVLLLPDTSDMIQYYALADVLIAPSREDAFHIPALEAMACGIPVIVSARAGVAELVEDGRQALVMDEPEDANALAEAVQRLISDRSLADRLRSEGRALALTRSWSENAVQTAALIRRAAEVTN